MRNVNNLLSKNFNIIKVFAGSAREAFFKKRPLADYCEVTGVTGSVVLISDRSRCRDGFWNCGSLFAIGIG